MGIFHFKGMLKKNKFTLKYIGKCDGLPKNFLKINFSLKIL